MRRARVPLRRGRQPRVHVRRALRHLGSVDECRKGVFAKVEEEEAEEEEEEEEFTNGHG